ncbi:MAG: hypothetical protein H7Z13_20520 [Ferruginibacter sp.]|nr:hypothetical protein [Ferruginibacter sp.]
MNWEVISNERSSLQEYRLIDNNDCKVVIKYNPRHLSARITCGNHHRLVYLESAGSLSGKTIFKNEYGMEVGNLLLDKFNPREAGTILIDTKKYLYQLHTNLSAELVIYDTDLQKPFASCSIPLNKTNSFSVLSTHSNSIDINCCIWGFCWFLFLPAVKENTLKLASADF